MQGAEEMQRPIFGWHCKCTETPGHQMSWQPPRCDHVTEDKTDVKKNAII